MAEHAFSEGLSVPAEVATLIDEGLTTFGDDGVQAPRPPRQSARDLEDALPVEKGAIASLAKAHAALALIIKPATPEAVLLLIEERRKHSAWYTFGPLPIVRQMLALAVLSLLVDAYQKRDRVGLIAFGGRSARLALPPTRSVRVAALRPGSLAAPRVAEHRTGLRV